MNDPGDARETLIRELREHETGFSRELWGKMAELGWQGITIPEEFGGLGEGMVEMIVVMEELGKIAETGSGRGSLEVLPIRHEARIGRFLKRDAGRG